MGFAFLHWLDFIWVWHSMECRGRGRWSSALCPGDRNKSSAKHSLHFHIIVHGLYSRLFSLFQSIGLSVYVFTCKDSMSHFLPLPTFFFSSSSKWWERPLPESTSICVRVGTGPSSSLTTSLIRLIFYLWKALLQLALLTAWEINPQCKEYSRAAGRLPLNNFILFSWPLPHLPIFLL